MTFETDTKLIKMYKETQKALAVSIKISHEEAMYIAVSNLLSKYHFLKKSRDSYEKNRYLKAFETVFEYFLDKEELKFYLDEKNIDSEEKHPYLRVNSHGEPDENGSYEIPIPDESE